MELYERLETVNSREDLIKFIFHLRIDLKTNSNEWENITLKNFIEAMKRG